MKYFRFTSTYNVLHNETINRVNKFCWYLSTIYEYYFKPIKTKGVSSLNVCFIDKQPENHIEISTTKDCFVVIDWDNLQKLTDENLMKYLLECCQLEIINCATNEGWDIYPFEKVYTEIVQKEYLLREYYKKPAISQNKNFKAHIYFEFDYKNDGIYVDFIDKKESTIDRIQFAKSGYLAICNSIGTISWLSDDIVRITESDRNNYWTVSLNGKVEYSNCNADKNDAHALYQVGLDYFDGTKVLKNEQKGLHSIQKSAELGYKHAKKWLERNTK